MPSGHPSDPEIDGDGTILSAVDWLGNRFHLGDLVLYCIGAGHGQLMAIGIVQQIAVRDAVAWVRCAGLAVQVLTICTSSSHPGVRRSKPAWVNPENVTALTNLEAAIHARSIMETAP